MAKHWLPDPIWSDEPCYIIGGGASLDGFNWDLLNGRNVIGCNAAFYLGVRIVPVTVFGDGLFLKQHREGLDEYARNGGLVVTNSNLISRFNPPAYLKQMKKSVKGLITDGLGWNGNTGASAINLALLFGADPIYLLGYDMQLSSDGRKNFHNVYNDNPNEKSYDRFLRGMSCVAKDLKKFPDQHIINLEDGTSALDVFPKESLIDHFCKELV